MTVRRIAIVIYSLHGGGAEHIVMNMAAHWAAKGDDIRIFTFTADPPPGGIAPRVTVVPLGLAAPAGNIVQGIAGNLRRVRGLRAVLRSFGPDVVISFMEPTNVVAILASWRMKWPVAVADRVDPGLHSYGRSWRLLRNLTYPFAQALVLQTERVKTRYPKNCLHRAVVIPNAVYQAPADPPAGDADSFVVAAMGRLDRQKGFDLLLEAFAGLDREFPRWALHIYGQGDEHERLSDMITALGLQGRAVLRGRTPDPAAALAACDIFVLSSRYEGFPNVLLEAMVQGRPVIAADCPMGPAEIVRDGENGLLIPANDPETLRRALRLLMRDAALRDRLGRAARAVRDDYDPARIMAQWGRLLAGLRR